MASSEILRDLTALKDRVEKLQREADRAAGALEQTLAQLKTEFGCSTLKEARTKLKELNDQEQKAREAFVASLDAFMLKYPDMESQ